jgi:hypothetical protein
MCKVMVLLGTLAYGIAATVFGAEIYVSPSGNDAAAGTQSAPLATLAAARDKADQLKASGPVTIYLRAGTYYLSSPLAFGPANSGTILAPIRYVAYGTEKPVISGGIKVTSAWTASSKASVMVTTIAPNLKVDQLFLNGQRQVLARYPNYDAGQPILNGYSADATSPSRVSGWANPGEGPGYLRGIDGNNWGGNSAFITGKNGTSLNLTPVGDNNRGQGIDAAKRLVENIYEELDAPGEWFYRKSTGQLFFYPPAGTTLASATIELASQDVLLNFLGSSASSANSVKYIGFKGITFTHAYRTLFSKPYEPVLRSDWCIARAGAVFIQNAENIVIQDCLFDQVGGNGVFMSGYNQHNVVSNCVFNDAGASCVAIMGLNSAMRCPNSWSNPGTCNDRTKGPLTNEYPTFITVDNNMMNHFGRFEKQPAGVALSRTECDTIRHNTLHDCPRAGICFCDGCWGGHIVEYNWIYNDVQETGDHGPFNAWGRDRNQRWPNDTTATTLDAWKTTIVRSNRFESKPGNFGIDLDDQASNYLQYNNLLIGGGLKLQWHRYNTYLNNVLVNGADAQIHGLWNGSRNYFARNILTSSQTYFIGFYNVGSANQNVDSVAHNVGMIDSNCLVANPTVNTDRGSPAWSYWISKGLDAHSVTGDPLFTDVNKTWPNYAPKGDYTVKSGSPALRIGFRNFPMDSFGVMPLPRVAIHVPESPGIAEPLVAQERFVNYTLGYLSVQQRGEYTVTVATPLGRTIRILKGNGVARFWLKVPRGIYIVTINAYQNRRSGKVAIY